MTVDGRFFNAGRMGFDRQAPVLAHLRQELRREDDRFTGGHLRARFERRHDDGTGWFAQVAVDRLDTTRLVQEGTQDGLDLSFQSAAAVGNAFVTWGGDYLARRTSLESDLQVRTLEEQDRWDHVVSSFVQVEMPVGGRDDLTALIGSKLSHNDFTGLEIQPSARLAWTPTDDLAAWAAVSRAVRVPSLVDTDILFASRYADTGILAGGPPSGVFVPLGNSGRPDTDAEELLAVEAGVRWRPHPSLTVDAAAFRNDYDRLRVTSPFQTNFGVGNNGEGVAWGGEVALTWQPMASWRLEGSWSLAHLDIEADRSAIRPNGAHAEQMAQVRSSWDVSDELRLDAVAAWTDRRPYFAAIGGTPVEDVLRVDLGLTWRPRPGVELSVWGRNLLDDRHPEFRNDFFSPDAVEIRRDVLVELTLRF